MVFTLNLILCILNLIPLPPLDGAGVIAFFLKEDTARKYRSIISNPMFGFMGILIAWQIINPIIEWAFPSVMNVLYWGAHFG
jgi:Zn-dependent protease